MADIIPVGGQVMPDAPGLVLSGPQATIFDNGTFFFVPRGFIVPRHYTSGYVVLAYACALMGSFTTFELLHRRTSGKGGFNTFLWIKAAITMGAVAIWAHDYIGYRTVSLCGDRVQYQVQYSPLFTALSVFFPILVLVGAFRVLGTSEHITVVRILVGGVLVGLAIAGTHYLGQADLVNYTASYQSVTVLGSVLAAIGVSIAALLIFYRLRATWTNSLLNRFFCSVLLAAAISGSFWISSIGTDFAFEHTMNPQSVTRGQTVIIVVVLALKACATLFVMGLVAHIYRARMNARAKQVVLTSVTFDSEGRLMVKPEGSLPCQKITNSYLERSFDDIFSIAHPVFLWVFRTSRNWSSVKGLLPGMRKHLQTTAAARSSIPGSRRSPGHGRSWPISRGSSSAFSEDSDGMEASEDYGVIFRELFCLAAVDLAAQFDTSLKNLGVLYDELMYTGTVGSKKRFSLGSARSSSTDVTDPEAAAALPIPAAFGRGQVLFVVRRVDQAEASLLATQGFRFADVPQVVDILAKTMQVESADLATRLASMERYSHGSPMLPAGVHLGCFALRATIGGGFDVLVRRDAKNLLPSVELPTEVLTSTHLALLQRADGWTVTTLLQWLNQRPNFSTPAEQNFATQLHDCLTTLATRISEPLFYDAKLVAQPTSVPCERDAAGMPPGRASLIALRLILPIHSKPVNSNLALTPLSVFKAHQRVYPNAPDHAIFARQTAREFDAVLRPGRVAAEAAEAAEEEERREMEHERVVSIASAPPSPPTGRATLVRKNPTSPRDSAATRSWFGHAVASLATCSCGSSSSAQNGSAHDDHPNARPVPISAGSAGSGLSESSRSHNDKSHGSSNSNSTTGRVRCADCNKGIMVSNEVSVNIDVKELPSSPVSRPLSPRPSVAFERAAMDRKAGYYAKGDEDLDLFVDGLFAKSFTSGAKGGGGAGGDEEKR